MNLEKRLSALFTEIVKEAKTNPAFAERIAQALEVETSTPGTPGRSNRRAPAVLDPFEEYKRGESVLRDRLAGLDVELLRDVIAQYGMDRSTLARKWKDKGRLIDLIVTTVTSRSEKGDAFRTPTGVPATGAEVDKPAGEDQERSRTGHRPSSH